MVESLEPCELTVGVVEHKVLEPAQRETAATERGVHAVALFGRLSILTVGIRPLLGIRPLDGRLRRERLCRDGLCRAPLLGSSLLGRLFLRRLIGPIHRLVLLRSRVLTLFARCESDRLRLRHLHAYTNGRANTRINEWQRVCGKCETQSEVA